MILSTLLLLYMCLILSSYQVISKKERSVIRFSIDLFNIWQESESTIKNSEYDVEKMTFEKEEELFPTVDDAIGKENVTVSSEVAEPVPDAKRKSPEKPADKKVGFVFYSCPWSLLKLSMFTNLLYLLL